jgi:hypothetical protein
MLRAQLAAGPDGRIAVPVAVPPDVTDVHQFLVILNATEHKLSVQGVERGEPVPVEMFGRWFSEPITKSVAGAFELHEFPSVIQVQPLETNQEKADQVVALERHRAWVSSGDTIWLESTLLVRSRTSGDLVLRLPQDTTPYDIRMNGRPIRPSTDADGRLSIFLSEDDRMYEVVLLSRRKEQRATGRDPKREIVFSRLVDSNCPVVWSVCLSAESRLESASLPKTCLSAAQVTEATVLANQLEYLVELPRASDDVERSTILGELENSLIAAAELARHTVEAEAELDADTRKLRQAQKHAARQLDDLMQKNRHMLQRLGTMGIRLPAETNRLALAQLSLMRPADESVASDMGPAGASGPPYGKPTFFVTRGQDLCIVTHMAPTMLSLDRFMPAFLAGLAGWWTSMMLGTVRARPSRWCLLLAATGLLWYWKLRPEPVGLLLLLAAVALTLVRLVRHMRRKRPLSPIR